MLNARQLAEKLNTSHTSIYRWVDKGMPHKYEKTGKKVAIRFNLEESEKWVADQKKNRSIRIK